MKCIHTAVHTLPVKDATRLHHICMRDILLTSHFLLLILFAFKDGVWNPHPRVMLAELWEQVVGYKPHSAGQDKQHDAEKRLRQKRVRVSVQPEGRWGVPAKNTEHCPPSLPLLRHTQPNWVLASGLWKFLPYRMKLISVLRTTETGWRRGWDILPMRRRFLVFCYFFFFIKKGWRITDLANRLFLVERKVRQQLSASTFSQKSHLEPSNFVSPTENYVPIIFLALWLPSHSRRWVLPSLLVVVSWEPVLLLLTVLTVDSTKCANKTTPQVGKQKGYECTLWCGSKLLLDITRNTSGYIPSSPQLAFSVLPLAPPSRQ